MPTSYRYRLLKDAPWGIAIDLRAEALPLAAEPPSGAERIAEGLYLQIELGRPLAEEEVGFLKLGLRLVAAEIAPKMIRIVGLEYNPCDYQPEGLAGAAAAWAARELGFPPPEIPVAFDRARNRYVFAFDQAERRPNRPAAAGS